MVIVRVMEYDISLLMGMVVAMMTVIVLCVSSC